MASGYQTSDGVDLDSRYLGINAKAKSAATADTATKANSVAWGNVSGKPGLRIQTATSNYVTVSSINLPWTAPVDCFIDYIIHANNSTNNYLYINGNQIGILSIGEADRLELKMYIRKGDVLSGTKYVHLNTLIYIPYKIS